MKAVERYVVLGYILLVAIGSGSLIITGVTR